MKADTITSQGVYPAQPNGPYLQDNSQLLCLDTLLTFVNHLSSRLEPQNDGRVSVACLYV